MLMLKITLPIRYFETWIKYIAGESIAPEGNRPGTQSREYFYRMNYPEHVYLQSRT
jgi:hypothetical protein